MTIALGQAKAGITGVFGNLVFDTATAGLAGRIEEPHDEVVLGRATLALDSVGGLPDGDVTLEFKFPTKIVKSTTSTDIHDGYVVA